jgi:hypothetical protein
MPVSVLNDLYESRIQIIPPPSGNESTSTPKNSQRNHQRQSARSKSLPSSDEDSDLPVEPVPAEDVDSDSEPLSGNWVPTPAKSSRDKDDLPADTPTDTPSKSSQRNTPYRPKSLGGGGKIPSNTPNPPEDHATPSKLKSAIEQQTEQSFTPVETPPTNLVSSSNITANSVEEITSPTAAITQKKNKVRRSRKSMPWGNREDSLTDSTQKQRSAPRTLASMVAEAILLGATSRPPPPKPTGPTLAQVIQAQLNSPATPNQSSRRQSGVQGDHPTPMSEPQSSMNMPSEVPQTLPKTNQHTSSLPAPEPVLEPPRAGDRLMSSQLQDDDGGDSLFIPSTHITVQSPGREVFSQRASTENRKDEDSLFVPSTHITIQSPGREVFSPRASTENHKDGDSLFVPSADITIQSPEREVFSPKASRKKRKDGDSLFVPNTDITIQSPEREVISPRISTKRRKDESAELEPPPVKRAKTDIRYIITQDIPVSQDPHPQPVQQREPVTDEAMRKSAPPISHTVVQSAEISVSVGPPKREIFSGSNTAATNSPALRDLGRSIFDRSTPYSPPTRPESRISLERTSNPSFVDIFKEFAEYYEAQGDKYKGNERRFYGMCKILVDSTIKWPEFLNDELIMRHADDYKTYVEECLDDAQHPMEFIDWAKKGIKGQRCHGGIMTEEKMDWAIKGYELVKKESDMKASVN